MADATIVVYPAFTGSRLSGFTSTRIAFAASDGSLTDSADLTFDDTNDRVSVAKVAGGSSSGGDLTVNSTSHATKGKIYFGASAYFDEANTRLLSPTVVGSSSSAGDLSLLSTTHATKGKVYLGTTAYWDETNTRMVAARLAGGSGSAGDITINSTSHATKGKIYFGSAAYINEASLAAIFSGAVDVTGLITHGGRQAVASDGGNVYLGPATAINCHLITNGTARLTAASGGTVSVNTTSTAGGTSTDAQFVVGNGDAFFDYGDCGSTGGGALRIASNANAAFLASNQYYDSSLKYARTGGSAGIHFDTSSGATAGDISFKTAASGSADAAITETTRYKVKQAGEFQIASSSGIAANNAQTVTVGNVGPGGAGVSIQKWWKVLDDSGNTLYVPLFG